MIDGVPESHQSAAEEIRAHLVALRGGAPFLAPADARLLVQWLDEGIAVSLVLRALERAAEARRRRRSRVPLALRHAKTHLGKPTRGVVTPPPEPSLGASPLAPVTEGLREQARSDPRGTALLAVADALDALDPSDPEALLRAALCVVRDFHEQAWGDLPEDDRAARLDAARAELGDLYVPDDPIAEESAEEVARDTLREAYPLLTAATLWDLVQP